MTRGSCDRSFGIHVARIANFPAHVVAQAESLAIALENGEPLTFQVTKAHENDSTDATRSDPFQPMISRDETARPTGWKRKVRDLEAESAVSESPEQKKS